jgi:hypothetical protein
MVIMKGLIKMAIVLMAVACTVNIANAQTTAKNKRAANADKIKAMLDARNYVFAANYVIPQRGSSRSLNYDYDVVVSKDTIKSYLPYFGQAHSAPIDPQDGGIKFTSTNFTYDVKQAKNGTYNITITPKETQSETQGSKDVRYLRLSASTSGYASLQVISNNRDPISFNGTIEERKTKK